MLGAGTPEDLVWPTSSPAYEPDKIDRFAFDLDKARSLLQQAGVSGASFEFMFNSVNSAHAVLAQLFQSDLQQIGLNATLRPVEAAAWSANTPKAQYNGLNVGPGGFAQVQPTTFFLFSVYWALNNNAEAFDSDEYRRLLGAASSEPDAAKRKALYSQINDFILDQAFVLMVGSNPEQFACRTNVHGVRYNLHQGIVHTDIWMS
jgi:peptide/nickel transport system substrate-binding protein